MGTFGAWLADQTDTDNRIGRFAQHVMHRHSPDSGCRVCRSKEDGEELTWGVADVVREMDGHHASPEFYEMLDEAAAAWGRG